MMIPLKNHRVTVLFSVVCLLLIPEAASARNYSFDEKMLNEEGRRAVDLSVFENGGQLPGYYPVDVFVNGAAAGTVTLRFDTVVADDGRPYLKACLSREILIRYGIRADEYPALFSGTAGPCADLTAISGAAQDFRFDRQQLHLSIPQIALQPVLQGDSGEAFWDEGIPAFILNYRISGSRTEYRGEQASAGHALWGSFSPGLNAGPWRFRNMTTWRRLSDGPGKWDTVYTRAERGLNRIRSRLVLGEDYTPSDIFDSVPFRGGMLGSDESMMPQAQSGFTSAVRGIARTAARIEVRRNGFLVYTTNVAPGAFALTDLPVTGGGDLQVTVYESDGSAQRFSVPFSTPAITLREGYLKYNVTAGQYRSSEPGAQQAGLGQFTAMYGFPQGITAFGGGQLADHYRAGALGIGFSAGGLGALSADVIHARGQKRGQAPAQGNTWRIRYNKTFGTAGTTFTAAAYQYSPAGYLTLTDVLDSYRNTYGPSRRDLRRSRRTTLTLDQSLGDLGSLSLNGTRDEYRDRAAGEDTWLAAFNTRWQEMFWSVSWARNRYTGGNADHRHPAEERFSVQVSLPLNRLTGAAGDIQATGQMQTASGQHTRYEAGLNGRAFDRRLYWDIRSQFSPGSERGQDDSRLGMAWNGTYGSLDGSYSYSGQMRQMNAGLSGSMVIHGRGITFGQQTGETVALVEAPGAAGVSVNGWPGVKTDFRGYTTLGYLTPYQGTVVSLDPVTFPGDVGIMQTDTRVFPTKGAVVPAEFQVRKGGRVLITLRQADGKPVPFGAVAATDSDTDAALVGDNGEVFMSGMKKSGRVKVQWGKTRMCTLNYTLPEKAGVSGIYQLHGLCR